MVTVQEALDWGLSGVLVKHCESIKMLGKRNINHNMTLCIALNYCIPV